MVTGVAGQDLHQQTLPRSRTTGRAMRGRTWRGGWGSAVVLWGLKAGGELQSAFLLPSHVETPASSNFSPVVFIFSGVGEEKGDHQ